MYRVIFQAAWEKEWSLFYSMMLVLLLSLPWLSKARKAERNPGLTVDRQDSFGRGRYTVSLSNTTRMPAVTLRNKLQPALSKEEVLRSRPCDVVVMTLTAPVPPSE